MIRLLKDFSKKDWLLSLIALIFILIQVWLELTMPDYMAEITTLVETEGSTMPEILRAGGMMLLCAVGSFAAAVVCATCFARIGSGFAGKLREELFNKVQTFSMAEMGRFSTASLITRSTNDIMQVQMFIVMGMQMLLRAPITGLWAIFKISTKQWEWLAVTGAAVVMLLVLAAGVLIIAMPKFKKMQILTDNLNRTARENLSGLRIVRAYNAEQYQEAKFEKNNKELTSNTLFTQRTMATMMPTIQLLMNGLSLAIYWIGAILINQATIGGRLSLFSDMMVFSQYAMQVVMAFMMLVVIFILWPRASVAASRILEVLNTKLSIEDGTKTEGLPGEKGEVEFRHVNFEYPGAEEAVLKDISFTVKPGQTLAIIGATGCGKSTLVNLIPRFYDATSGEVLVDGVNVKDYSERALRNKIGYISQSAALFSGTIADNIAFGDNGQKPISKEQIEQAARLAQADEFIEGVENKYDGFVAQSGQNYSGGQKQRISIARALARKPEILIFDDSFSALDFKTDRALREGLEQAEKDVTKIIVAQRIGTIRHADEIIVLDKGEIVGKGTHDELMENCPVYQEIALSQLSRKELE